MSPQGTSPWAFPPDRGHALGCPSGSPRPSVSTPISPNATEPACAASTERDDMYELVAVVGAGTMGAGIAQVAALAGHHVLLLDAAPGAAKRAIDGIRDQVRV